MRIEAQALPYKKVIMLIYLFLFIAGFLNEALLTSYYINAAKGKKWLCVGLSLGQQIVSIGAMFFNLVDVEPKSIEQLIRFIITAFSYATATYFIVGKEENK
jgi:hypothetical protein